MEAPLHSSAARRAGVRSPGWWRVCGWACGALASTLAARAAPLPVAGSDLLAPPLAQPVDAFNRDNPRPLALALKGTLAAMHDLRENRAALAIVALKPDEKLDAAEFRAVPVAYATVVFAVPAGSAARQVTLAQLAGIFGEGQGADARRWSDLGFTGEWSAKAIAAHRFVAPGSLSLELFRHVVLRSPNLRQNLGVHASSAELIDRVVADDGAIALLSAPRDAGGKLALLAVARDAQAAAVPPTPETLHAGEYPLRVPFVVVFKPARRADVFEAVRFLLSEEIAEAFAAADLVPVPREARNAALFELEAGK